jgi:Zn2+/Cd2+-exporting ATPase
VIGRFSRLDTYRHLFDVKDIARVGIGGFFALVGFLMEYGNGFFPLLGKFFILTSVAINGFPIIRGAIAGLIDKKINVDELVSLAILASLVMGEFLSAAVISFVMVLGSLIEEATAATARRQIQSLVEMTPTEATVIDNGKSIRKPVSDIFPEDILLIRPGELIPVDAVITKGIASVDESSITGEPIPIEKTIGDEVYSGTLNQNGVIHIKATRVGKDSTLGKVITLITEAENHHPESVALIDRYAQWFTPTILFCSVITWFLTGEIQRAITVLIVGCPCALILAAPTAVVAAISKAARRGVLIKGGRFIENVAYADVVLFDKTGTLTMGEPIVEEIVSVRGFEKNHVLRQAACVEQNSTHPLAKAVIKAAQDAGISVDSAENILTEIGRGVKGCVNGCQVHVGNFLISDKSNTFPEDLKKNHERILKKGSTALLVYQDNVAIGLIAVSDPIRPDAKQTLENLRTSGVTQIGILSGDHEQSVKSIANQLGASDYGFSMQPKDKLDTIRKLQLENNGRKVIFIGDGINDAPALSIADVGIAMGAKGTQVALETADIALMNDDISKLPFLIWLGKRMVFIIKLNIILGLTFNLIAVLAGGGGYLSPITGAVVHNVGSVLVVLSSASIAFSSDK